MTFLRPLERPAYRRASALALALLIVVFAVQTWRKAHRPDGNDLTSYFGAARALASGLDPYAVPTPFPYIYPLFPALALMPLAALPYGAAVLLWYAVSVAALGWTFAIFARREVRTRQDADALSIAAIVLVLTIQIVQNNLLNGQINFIVLACCAAALAASRTLPAALPWAAAIATKILPLVLTPWWILRRRMPVVLLAALFVLVFLLAPTALTGTAVFARYAREFVAGSLARGAPDDSLRFSLYGMLVPLTPAVPWLPVVCGLIVIGLTTWWDMRNRSAGDDHVAYALYLAAIPLASPKSETHHLAFALPAAYICALRTLRYWIPAVDWRRQVLRAAVVFFFVGSVFDGVRNWCWFLALVLLSVATAGLMARTRPA